MADRPYDIVLLGATGFTGTLTARWLATAARREKLHWALAGRNRDKLDDVRRQLTEVDPGVTVDLVEADTGDDASLARLAASTRVLITTVGPYLQYGEGVLRACVEAGTHYVDLTGEPEFVDRSRAQWHDLALRNGTRIVHCCGFDSIPHDLGVLYTLAALRERLGEDAFAAADVTVRGFVQASGSFSGGTWNSAIGQFARAREYWKNRPRHGGADNHVHNLPPRLYREPRLQRWACPLPTIDPQVVCMSARLRGDYGREFSYGHYLLADHLLPVLGGIAGVAGLFALAQLPPAARLLAGLRPPGAGPDAQQRADSWFRVRFIAEANGSEVICEVSGGDPGYDETAKMLAESALCLAFDQDLPPHAGVSTPAAAMGEALIRRLERAGLRFARVR